MPIILRHKPDPSDNEWIFQSVHLPKTGPTKSGEYRGLHISFTPESITLDSGQFPSNRILQTDDKNLFILASFGALRFPDVYPSVNIDYIKRVLKSGVHINGRHFWFYGHSNSQLRSRSCFLREAANEEILHRKVLAMGNFESIKSPAKLAKRIGLLFSSATLDWVLDPKYVKDIPDIEIGDTLFSDGCGLISRHYSRLLAGRKRIIFRQQKYTPCVVQIRYRGYKARASISYSGVLMMHPPLDKEQQRHVHFRKSMKKFTATSNDTFSIVGHSQPYIYARLNSDIVTLLSALGITNETFLRKLHSYLDWLKKVPTELNAALNFLSSVGQHAEAERVLLEGLESPKIQAMLTDALKREIASFKKGDTNKDRLRLLVHDSRYLYGVCDPFQVLEEGEVFVSVTMPRGGPRAIHSCPVLVVRNPCLHPGDCLKLRAVYKEELSHLVDCVVFASKGKHAAPSLSSGGDLDGDQYTVIWDEDLVQPKVAEHFLYPAVKERQKVVITRQDLVAHFAGYNRRVKFHVVHISMGRAASLHAQWVRTKGAMSKECQELNALYSQCVDGAIIKIPERLRSPPTPSEPFIVDIMLDECRAFAQEWLASHGSTERSVDPTVDEEVLTALLTSDRVTLTEFQTLQLAWRIARRSSIDIKSYIPMMNFGSLSPTEKRIICHAFDLTPDEQRAVWNR
ncbi:RdRP-domain-containing protein [Serendipita vermifera]|nr:RdRP-domain-containing protein [Serendipita vermifera]